MKRIQVLKIFAILVAATTLFVSCTKDISDERLDPKLATTKVANITSAAATLTGFVIAAGDGFTEMGVCYNTQPNPTIANSKVVYTGDKTRATFNVVLDGLAYATKYYAKAYATGEAGTIYGEEMEFTTLPVIPTLTTTDVTDIQGTSAKSGGNITKDGGAAVTKRGVVYGTAPNPTIEGSKTEDGTGTGVFTSNITGLSGLTKYYVRAYATNSAGTAYGQQFEFTTLVSIRTWYIPGDYVEASYPGTTFANWSPGNCPFVRSSEASPNNLEGYVYMANPSNQWKFTDGPSWDVNYGSSDGSTLEPGGSNINSPAGYYKINANVTAMTYTAIATVWGVIGSATPNGWNDETPLEYDPASRTWRGGLHLTAAEFKFRANHNWDYNYGSSAGNATLNAGGDNIPVSVEADYHFILDLSNPNAYTYSANRWGLIGSATPGGWSDDTNMTWNPITKSMTLTVDLVVGEIKFRANDGWDVNLGGPLNALTPGGDNIPITEAGNYTIHLFLVGNGGTCTIVKN